MERVRPLRHPSSEIANCVQISYLKHHMMEIISSPQELYAVFVVEWTVFWCNCYGCVEQDKSVKSWEASLFKAAIWNITWWDHKFPPRAHSFCFWVDSGVVTAWVCGARGRADKIYLEIWSYRVVVYPVMVFNVNQCPKALPLNCVTHPLASPQTRLVDRYIRNKAKPIPKTGANASLN